MAKHQPALIDSIHIDRYLERLYVENNRTVEAVIMAQAI
jgi:hypothetical protein